MKLLFGTLVNSPFSCYNQQDGPIVCMYVCILYLLFIHLESSSLFLCMTRVSFFNVTDYDYLPRSLTFGN